VADVPSGLSLTPPRETKKNIYVYIAIIPLSEAEFKQPEITLSKSSCSIYGNKLETKQTQGILKMRNKENKMFWEELITYFI
jgi:hypothetical protein